MSPPRYHPNQSLGHQLHTRIEWVWPTIMAPCSAELTVPDLPFWYYACHIPTQPCGKCWCCRRYACIFAWFPSWKCATMAPWSESWWWGCLAPTCLKCLLSSLWSKSVVPLNECEQTVRSMVRECRAYTIVCNYKGGRVCHRCWCIWHEKPHANSPPNGDKTRYHDSSCQAQHRHTSIASEQHVPPSHLHRMSMEEYVGVGVPILGMPPLDILGHKMPHGYVCMYVCPVRESNPGHCNHNAEY